MTEETNTDPLKMPEPTGFRILCAVPKVDDTFGDTGILKPELQKTIEQHSTVVLFVLKLGPEAYKDASKFPSGAYCKEGDFVLVRAYTGTRFKINGNEFRIIYDDHVEGVVSDPRGISRAA
jgi:co-chaperonin GroES (HSP10)